VSIYSMVVILRVNLAIQQPLERRCHMILIGMWNVQGSPSLVRFPLPPGPCQTYRIKYLTTTIYLTLAVIFGNLPC
jgi:hypothetical protein